VTNNVFWTKKSKTTTTTIQKMHHKSPCQSRESNPVPLAPHLGPLPLDHDSIERTCFKAMGRNVNKQI